MAQKGADPTRRCLIQMLPLRWRIQGPLEVATEDGGQRWRRNGREAEGVIVRSTPQIRVCPQGVQLRPACQVAHAEEIELRLCRGVGKAGRTLDLEMKGIEVEETLNELLEGLILFTKLKLDSEMEDGRRFFSPRVQAIKTGRWERVDLVGGVVEKEGAACDVIEAQGVVDSTASGLSRERCQRVERKG